MLTRLSKHKLYSIAISLLFTLVLVLGACSYEAMAVAGVIEIRATDAPPTGISSIVVTVNNIQVHKSGADEDSWITVIDSEKTFDLVDIQGAEVFLGDEEVEAGRYTQIRLDVTAVTVTLDGAEVSAELPSDKLKVVSNWEVTAGETTILTLDFEADKFVVVTGASQADELAAVTRSSQVQVKPVVKLEVTHGDRPLKTAVETESEGED